jgi:hypothetical protein
MSLRKRVAKILLFAVLEVGALVGVPMSPRQIEELLNLMNRTEIHETIKHDGGLIPPA